MSINYLASFTRSEVWWEDAPKSPKSNLSLFFFWYARKNSVIFLGDKGEGFDIDAMSVLMAVVWHSAHDFPSLVYL